jgi:hypothetical protein
MRTNFTPPAFLRKPLVANKNATLSFLEYIDLDTEDIDSETGNLNLETQETTIEIIARHKEQNLADIQSFGVESDRQYLICRLTNPLTYPKLAQVTKATVIFDSGEIGDFDIKRYIQNPYLNSELGDRIYGYFRRRN